MKKLLFAFVSLLLFCRNSHALIEEWNYLPNSSFTDVATPGPIMFTSATIQFVSIIISSTAPNSYLAFYRSTSSAFTANLDTQVLINTDYQTYSNGPTYVPLEDIRNSSFTYFSKVGTARVMMLIRCIRTKLDAPGICPSL